MIVNLTVNDASVRADVAPRTHLADFLREDLLLTGTHIGCEHGVCGACTILIDGEPARSCITFAATCDSRDVTSIEGLEHDPVVAALRTAFSAEHALQCGYCTPGMLVTARDIVMRIPDADNDRIRLELAGNLCRCTGYNGIVRAIRRVLDHPPAFAKRVAKPIARRSFKTFSIEPSAKSVAQPAATPTENGLQQVLHLAAPVDQVWAALRDPALIASCLPGARITAREGDAIKGEMLVALGPIQATFTGDARLTYDDAARSGEVKGSGQDRASGTRLSAEAKFNLASEGETSRLTIEIDYTLKGPLAQFSRGPVVHVVAAELAQTVARNLEARLRGEEAPAQPAPLRAGQLMARAAWRWWRDLLSRLHVR